MDFITRVQNEICLKVLMSNSWDAIDVEDLYEDIQRLRQLQELEHDMIEYGNFKVGE